MTKTFTSSKKNIGIFLAVLVSSTLFSIVIIATCHAISPIAAIALPFCILISGMVVLHPFIGVIAMAMFTQLDALAHLIFQSLPVSGIKLLTVLTLAGFLINGGLTKKKTVLSIKKENNSRDKYEGSILRLAILFVIALSLSFIFVEDMQRGFWSVRRFFSLIVLFFIVQGVIKTSKQIEIILLTIVLSTLLSSVIVITDWTLGSHIVSSDAAATTAKWGGVTRSSGASDYNPTTAATMMLTGVTLSIMLLLKMPKWKGLTGATVFFGTIGIVLSFARSAALVYVIAVAWLFFKYKSHRNMPIALMFILMLSFAAIPFVPTKYWERMSTLINFKQDSSLSRRISYNLIGLDLFSKNPLLGVGPGNFPNHYSKFEYRWMPGRELIPRQLHNTYLEVLTETGIVGFGCFFGMILMALKGLSQTYKNGSSEEIKIIAECIHFCFVSFLIASVFMPNEYNKYLWMLIGISSVVSRLGLPSKNSYNHPLSTIN